MMRKAGGPARKIDTRLVVTLAGLAMLVVLAAIEKSIVMFVSVVLVGVAVYVFRTARLRDRIIATIAAALGGSIGAEIVRTFYDHLGAVGAESLFMTAMLIGLFNAVAAVIVIVVAEAIHKRANRESHHGRKA